jgi:hypothetical protein
MVMEVTRQQPKDPARFMIEYLQKFGGYTSTGLTIDEKKELESLRLQVKKISSFRRNKN